MRIFTRFFCASVVSGLALSSALAAHDFNKTTAGGFDSTDNANWNNGVPTGDGQDVNFTQTINAGDQTVTNLTSANNGALNYLRLATGGSSLLTVITTGSIDSQFGLQLNARDTLILNGSSSTLSHGNNSFDNSFGTLILSNSAVAFINIGGNAVQNQGTIVLSSGNTDLNYGQSSGGAFNNSGTGTIVKDGTGTGRFTGNFGGNNIAFVNNGSIIVNNGTLVINPADAFDQNGFRNGSRIFINGSTFAIDRTANAWNNDGTPANDGTILLNGGTLTALQAGSQAANRFYSNNALIAGSGTIAASIKQGSTGSTIGSNGVLNLFGTFGGNQATFTSVGTDFGTFKAKSGGTLRLNGNVASGMGGAWTVDSGGTLEVSSGFGVDLGASFMPGSGLNGTVKVNSGANLTLSSAAAAGPALNQNGTFLFNGGTISMPNASGLGRFTNSSTGVLYGNGVFRTGYGPGNNNYGVENIGTVIATNGLLTVFSDDAADVGGFQNQGTVRVKSDGTLTITRSDNAWTTGVIASPTNTGSIFMEGGTLRGSNTTVGTLAGKLVNASGGLIIGSGLVQGFTTVENSGVLRASGGTLTVGKVSAPDRIFLVNKLGGVVTANTANVVIQGTFTNQSGGTFTMVNGVGTFDKVVNSGAWVTDPSTNIFNGDMIVTSSGSISAAAGDVYIFKSNFVNQSTQNTTYDTLNTTPGSSGAAGTKFIFDGTNTVSSSSYTQQFFTAGLKLTGGFVGTPSTATQTQQVSSFAAVTGFQDNFAIDRLELGNAGTNSILEMFDTFGTVQPTDGNIASLFVNDLFIFGSSKLIISNNVNVYFVNSNNWSSANYQLIGTGELHQLVLAGAAVVPEPSVLLLWMAGFGTVYASRRRRKNQKLS